MRTTEDHIIFDCEIKLRVEDAPGGWDNPGGMGVSVAVVYEYATDRYRIYGDTEKELQRLQQRLLQADRIGGFNIRRFDIPLVFGGDRTFRHPDLEDKVDDALERIWLAQDLDPDHFDKRTHGGWGLDNVASATFGHHKIGNGADAPIWYQNGEWYRVVNYCVDDVALERKLSEYINSQWEVKRRWNGAIERLAIPPWSMTKANRM